MYNLKQGSSFILFFPNLDIYSNVLCSMKISSPDSDATCMEYTQVLFICESASGLFILFYLSIYNCNYIYNYIYNVITIAIYNVIMIASKYFREYLESLILLCIFFNLGYYRVFSSSYEI